MSALSYIYKTRASTASNATTSYVEVDETTALTSGTTYIVIAHGLVKGDNVNKTYAWRLVDRTNSDAVLSDSELIKEPMSTSSSQSYSYIGQITAGSGGGGIAFEQKAVAAATTASTEYLSLLLLDMSNLEPSDWFFAQDSSGPTQHTTSYVSRVSYAQANQVDEPWLIMGWCATATDNLAKRAEMEITSAQAAGMTVLPTCSYEGEDFTETLLNWMGWVHSPSASDTATYAVKTRDSDTHATPNDYLGASIFGLRLGAMKASAYSETAAAQTTTSTAFNTYETATPTTPGSSDTLIAIGSAVADMNATGRNSQLAVQDEGTTVPNTIPDDSNMASSVSADAGDELPNPYVALFTASQADPDITMEMLKSTPADVGWKHAALAVFTTQIAEGGSIPVTFGSVAAEAYTSGDKAAEPYASGDKAAEARP